MSYSELEQTQSSYEQRFNCIVCLCPKLEMVYGFCQHRICVDCLYAENGMRRPSFERCPSCQKMHVFPFQRPDIPEDNIEHQKCLGIRRCTNTGCKVDVWEWEMEEHLLICPNRTLSKLKVSRRQSAPVNDAPNKRSKGREHRERRNTRLTRSKTNNLRESLQRLRPRRDTSES